jgi:hypothetical protein
MGDAIRPLLEKRTYGLVTQSAEILLTIHLVLYFNLTYRTFAVGPKTLPEILLQDLAGAILR